MTVIYVDTLFLLNAVIDYLLLLAAARLAGEPLPRRRFALGGPAGWAVCGGHFSARAGLSFAIPSAGWPPALGMLLAAYGGSRRLVRQGLIFLALTCAFGGGVVAIGLMGGEGLTLGRNGVFYSSLDLKLVLLSAAGCYGVLTLAFSASGGTAPNPGSCYPPR
ncbi:MAG: sigma-E processing peptidase SpoIIGA [Lawsonibacter sp.]